MKDLQEGFSIIEAMIAAVDAGAVGIDRLAPVIEVASQDVADRLGAVDAACGGGSGAGRQQVVRLAGQAASHQPRERPRQQNALG